MTKREPNKLRIGLYIKNREQGDYLSGLTNKQELIEALQALPGDKVAIQVWDNIWKKADNHPDNNLVFREVTNDAAPKKEEKKSVSLEDIPF